MKRLFTIVILMLLVVMPAIMPAATFWDEAKAPISQILGVVLTILGVPLLMKLGRKMGLDIDQQLANDAIDALINIVVNIDIGKGGDSVAKKRMAVTMANNTLPNAKRELLIKKYGSMDAAVQVAFERSSLSNKAGK